MYSFEQFERAAGEALQKAGVSVKERELSVPPDSALGDLSFTGCFRLAKEQKKAPQKIAEEIAGKAKAVGLISAVKAAGSYVNFFVNTSDFSQQTLAEAARADYGSSAEGKGKTVVIDYSSPNIAKPFSVGHLRSTIIGDCLKKSYRLLGFRVVGLNYVGDWGTQFGKLGVAFEKWGDKKTVEANPIKKLLALYVRFHKEAEADKSLEDEARAWFAALDRGDGKKLELWKWFKEVSLVEFKRLYALLGVEFDELGGESLYAAAAHDEIEKALKTGVAVREPDGSVVVPLEQVGLTNYLLGKKDESTLYSARDLACARDHYSRFKFWRKIIATGGEQRLNFQQLFKTIELMREPYAGRLYHVWFGLVRLPEGKMSTRKGRVVFLDEVLNEAVERARKAIDEKEKERKDFGKDIIPLSAVEKVSVARAVGIGAVKFADLSQNKIKDVMFDWDKMLDFEGDTAPYLQYAVVRCRGILDNAGKTGKPDYAALAAPEEKGLVLLLSKFPQVVRKAALDFETHALANYLLDLAHTFTAFYNACPVAKCENAGLKAARAELVKATANTLRAGLTLLGIESPERM